MKILVALLKFKKQYLIYAIIILIIEIGIALFIHDNFIRSYVGDFLVVILIYCFLQSFLSTEVWRTATGVLLFYYIIEILQYFYVLNKAELQKFTLARIILGTSFEWIDIGAYTAGIALVLFIESAVALKRSKIRD